jgi:general secretion pathway protein L
VLASTAIADFVTYCRGESGPLGVLVSAPGAMEVALLSGGQLVSSQLLPTKRLEDPAALERSVARQLSDQALSAESVPLYRWELANGAAPGITMPGEGDLLAMARGRLEAPDEFFSSTEPAMLPAVGAALDAVREGTVPLNLLPMEGRRGADEGLSLTTVVLVALTALLLLVWGGSALVKDALLRRQLQDQLESIEPQVREVKSLQDDVERLQRELDALSEGQEPRVTPLLKDLTELVPNDAYLTGLNLRGDKLSIDGQARSASDLITALEKSKHFKNVTFSSPTTKQGDKERFSIVAEAAGQ